MTTSSPASCPLRPKPKDMLCDSPFTQAQFDCKPVLQNSERSDPAPNREAQLHCEEAVYWFAFNNPWGGAVYSFRGEEIEEEKRRMRNEVATKQYAR